MISESKKGIELGEYGAFTMREFLILTFASFITIEEI